MALSRSKRALAGPDDQLALPLDASSVPTTEPVPDLRDEIARVWNLPLGAQVEVTLRRGACDSLRGRLVLAAAPSLPWNPREPLALTIAGVTFSSRDLERWTVI